MTATSSVAFSITFDYAGETEAGCQAHYTLSQRDGAEYEVIIEEPREVAENAS